MDKFLTDIVGKMPIVLDDFRFVDAIYRNAFFSYLKAIKAENCILHGCEITHIADNEYKVSEGAVAINSEIFICDEATFTTTNLDKCYFTIFENYDPQGNKIFGDYTRHDTYLLRRVKVLQYDSQPANTLSIKAGKLENLLIYEGDSRLTDSRKCNNTFDNASTARNNLNVYSKSEVYHKNNTYNKSETYSKTEVNNKLNNKVDKVSGKQLSTNDFTNTLKNKLDNIANNANNYTHPATHSINMITDSSTHVKMTKAERSKLSGIASNANNYAHPATHSINMITDSSTHVKMTKAERSKLSGIASNANNYAHPATHSINMITDSSTHVKMTKAERSKLANMGDDNISNMRMPLFAKTISSSSPEWYISLQSLFNGLPIKCDFKFIVTNHKANMACYLPACAQTLNGVMCYIVCLSNSSQAIKVETQMSADTLYFRNSTHSSISLDEGEMLLCIKNGNAWHATGWSDL